MEKLKNVKFITILTLNTILISSSLLGCAKDSGPPASVDNSLPAKNIDDARKIADKAVLHCLIPGDCSPSVGMLVGTVPDKAYQCTAFLVARDMVATNSHCVPDDLKTVGADCSGRVSFLFPKLNFHNFYLPNFYKSGALLPIQFSETTNMSADRVDCASVMQASHITGQTGANPDYAFLKLQSPLDRPIISISRDGFKQGALDYTDYNVIKVDPYLGNHIPEGYMRKITCKSVYSTIFIPGSNTETSSVMAFGDCDVVHGNSGSPIFDESGKARGIIFGGVELDKALGELNHKIPLLFEGQARPVGLGTNYACVELPPQVETQALPAAACRVSANTSDYESLLNAIQKDMQKKAVNDVNEQFVNSGIVRNEHKFLWELANIDALAKAFSGDDEMSSFVMPVPKCVASAEEFLAGVDKDLSGNYPATTTKAIRFSGQLLGWLINFGLNEYFQFSYKIAGVPADAPMFIQFSPNDFARTGSTQLQAVVAKDATEFPFFDGKISTCQ